MSYRPDLPNNPYGDELQDDTWSTSGQPSPSSSPGYPQQPNYANPYQRPNPMPRNFSQQLNQPMGVVPNRNQALTQPPEMLNISMSPEDLMFMKQIRSELFLTRIAPISIAAYSLLYYYNRSKQLPQSIGRYIIVGFGSIVLSMMTYKSQFRRRVVESPLSTPYIEAIRRNLGVQSRSDYFGAANELNQISEYTSPDRWNTNSTLEPYGDQSTSNQQPTEQSHTFDAGFEKTNDAKPMLSYEELRAKNRGYSR